MKYLILLSLLLCFSCKKQPLEELELNHCYIEITKSIFFKVIEVYQLDSYKIFYKNKYWTLLFSDKIGYEQFKEIDCKAMPD